MLQPWPEELFLDLPLTPCYSYLAPAGLPKSPNKLTMQLRPTSGFVTWKCTPAAIDMAPNTLNGVWEPLNYVIDTFLHLDVFQNLLPDVIQSIPNARVSDISFREGLPTSISGQRTCPCLSLSTTEGVPHLVLMGQIAPENLSK